jgi:hypothetical protein
LAEGREDPKGMKTTFEKKKEQDFFFMLFTPFMPFSLFFPGSGFGPGS